MSTTYKIGLVLDRKRLESIKGTPIESMVKDIFGGALKIIEIEVPEDLAKRILSEFARARVDARGFLEDLPVAFKRELFNLIVEAKRADAEVVKKLLDERLSAVKEAAAKEEEYLPPPA
ncbi:MAG: hypothetical protein B6V02_01665 [Thermoprotei archaeon ex4572_64]|nr:MAG: hypothetical protein B6V02_01665 [Thermoprotei archaeon ex4572_64]